MEKFSTVQEHNSTIQEVRAAVQGISENVSQVKGVFVNLEGEITRLAQLKEIAENVAVEAYNSIPAYFDIAEKKAIADNLKEMKRGATDEYAAMFIENTTGLGYTRRETVPLASLTHANGLDNGFPDYSSGGDSIWRTPLPCLTEANYAFDSKRWIHNFDADVSHLVNGKGMFKLKEGEVYQGIPSSGLWYWNRDLPRLVDGSEMFLNNNIMRTFKANTSSLVDGVGMFSGCTSLCHVDMDLSNLKSGTKMFEECKLDIESIEKIAGRLSNVTVLLGDENDDDSSGRLSLGIAKWVRRLYPERWNNAVQTILDKGWELTVKITGSTEDIPTENLFV